ncbi:MAG: hypothetical protein JXQ73_29785 [Phycisphaerae bacterium]|nr:hypothetical protein [Phycisphaerae bacterium]
MMRRHRVVPVHLVGIVALSGLASAAERGGVHLRFSTTKPETITVSGKITDTKTGKPIADAIVGGALVTHRYLGPEMFDACPVDQTRSGANGEYALTFQAVLTISGPMKGKDIICVHAGAPGFETRPKWVRPYLTPGRKEYTGVDLALGPGKLVKGEVVDEDGKPIEGALVSVAGRQSAALNYFNAQGCATTDGKGAFGFWSTSDKEVLGREPWLQVIKPGYGLGRYWDPLEKDDMGRLVLPRGCTIAGAVVDQNGKPVSDCEVCARALHQRAYGTTRTDKAGKYELKGIPGEPSYVEFFKKKGLQVNRDQAKVTVYARTDPKMNLRDAPQYEILPKEGQTLAGPGLIIGQEASVSGKLIPSKTIARLKGLLVRLDHDWNYMVEVDADGGFHFPFVRPGKHRLTAYLPNNLRGDRGVGHTQVTIEPGTPRTGIKIQLETLAEVRMRFLDADGNPLKGITAGATWTQSGDGFWTEGTVSDETGRAVVYLYPWQKQYVRGFDMERRLVAEGFRELRPAAGRVIDEVQIVMVPMASIRGRLVSEDKSAIADRAVICRLLYADSVERRLPVKTDSQGRFELARQSPGVVRVEVETDPAALIGSTTDPIEIKPGETKDIGDLLLKKVKFYKVSGRVLPSSTITELNGLKIRLDLRSWQPMLTTDAEGRFVLPNVSAGKHRLTAYLPFNLRTDRGIGHTDVTVKDQDVANVELRLETLAKVHMRITDESGKPLEGISAAAWWTENHSGVFTEGSKSGKDGKATLYVYPDQRQYVGAHHWDRVYELTRNHEMTLKPGQVVEDLHVVMRRP